MEDFRIKYRPQKIGDIWGNEHIKKIWNGFSKRRAYPASIVLYGQYGTGKTTIGEMITKEITVNITDPKCRPLCEFLYIDTPQYEYEMLLNLLNRVPCFIGHPPAIFIDEAHSLPEKSQRLFLNRIEKDPLHYIFATTELNKLHGGILSRSTKLHLRAPKSCEAEEKLSDVAKTEGINITKDAIKFICDYANCNPRECVGILNDIAGNEEEITESSIKEMVGIFSV